MNDFLQPKAMITPGLAGGTVMLIANTCNQNLGVSAPLCAIVLSFLISLLIVANAEDGWQGVPFWQKAIIYVLNSLIVFSVATGSATTASGVAKASQIQPASASQAQVDLQSAIADHDQVTQQRVQLENELKQKEAVLENLPKQFIQKEPQDGLSHMHLKAVTPILNPAYDPVRADQAKAAVSDAMKNLDAAKAREDEARQTVNMQAARARETATANRSNSSTFFKSWF